MLLDFVLKLCQLTRPAEGSTECAHREGRSCTWIQPVNNHKTQIRKRSKDGLVRENHAVKDEIQ